MTLYPIYKFLVYIPWLVLSTLANFLGVCLVAPFSPRHASRWFARAWGRCLMWGVPARVTVRGRAQLDTRQAYIVVSNHLSLMDIPTSIETSGLAIDRCNSTGQQQGLERMLKCEEPSEKSGGKRVAASSRIYHLLHGGCGNLQSIACTACFIDEH